MRFEIVALVLCILGANAAQLTPQQTLNSERAARIYETQILEAIEKVRQLLLNGLPEINVPPLDPLALGDINVDLATSGIPNVSGNVQVSSVNVAGIAGWTDPEVDVSVTIFPPGASFTFVLRWPQITWTSSNYDVNANALGNTVVGSGNVNGRLTDLAVSLRGSYNALTGNVRGLNAEIILADSSLELGSLAINGQDISGPVSQFVNNLPVWIIENQDNLDKLMEALVEWINNRYF